MGYDIHLDSCHNYISYNWSDMADYSYTVPNDWEGKTGAEVLSLMVSPSSVKK